MITKKVLIFGASGQIGRHCIKRLVRNNYKVIAITRNSHKSLFLKTQAPIGYLDLVESNIFDEQKLNQLVSEADICINLVGILFEKDKINTFSRIHSDFPEKLSEICYKKNVDFIHLSALGLEKAKDSKYALSKISGEEKIRQNFPKATIIKPSIVYSVDDNFSTKILSLLRILPFFPIYYKGETKYTPIHATDIAELIFYVISKKIISKDIEAIGPNVLTFKEMIKILLKSINKKKLIIPMPLILAKMFAYLFQLMPNPLLTCDQLRLLKYDNVKTENGITNFDVGCPSKISFERSILSYSYNWRDGGKYSVKEGDYN